MVIASDVGWDHTLINEMEDCCANLHHGEDAWPHDAKPNGGVDKHVVLIVAYAINAC